MLTSTTEVLVRFSEADAMGVVWHGNYLRYFEDGREAFGRTYNMTYLDVFNFGFLTPIVKIHCNYKRSLNYGDTAIIETTYVDHDAAKLHFKYTIYRKGNNEIVATGESEQVFLNEKKELHLTLPDFFRKWKKKWGLLP
ncbi:MAG TPA: thioesterase family protein [Cytophagales bacterium]|nr:thioesterase family protein [Cytophagales bacterium]